MFGISRNQQMTVTFTKKEIDEPSTGTVKINDTDYTIHVLQKDRGEVSVTQAQKKSLSKFTSKLLKDLNKSESIPQDITGLTITKDSVKYIEDGAVKTVKNGSKIKNQFDEIIIKPQTSNGRIISKNQFIDLMKELSEQPIDEMLEIGELLKTKGFAPVLSGIDFHIAEITVKERPGRGIKPFWGTDFLQKLKFNDITFNNCNFHYVNFSGSSFKNCTFDKCNMTNTTLEKCNFNNTNFTDTNLNGALFEDSSINHSNFLGCKLNYTNFTNAKLQFVKFSNGNSRVIDSVDGVNFRNAQFNKCKVRNYDLTNSVFDPSVLGTEKLELNTVVGQANRAVAAVMWNNQAPGTTATKLFDSLKKDLTPIKINYVVDNINAKELDLEIKNLLKIIESRGEVGSIPYELIQIVKSNPESYPNAFLLIQKGKEIISQIDSLVLPGGLDVEPEFFGQVRKQGVHQCEPNYIRSLLEFALLNEAKTKGVPVLGVCRGAQMVNVFGGGTLRPVREQVEKVQKLEVKSPTDRGIIPGLLKRGGMKAYSEHKHAINTLPSDLQEVVRYDEITKGAESKHGAPLVITQFHPEFAKTSGSLNQELSDSKSFWKFIGGAGMAYRNRKVMVESFASELQNVHLRKVNNPEGEIQIATPGKLTQKNLLQIFGKKLLKLIRHLVRFLGGGFSKVRIDSKAEYVDENKLMKGGTTIDSVNYSWYLNFALLRDAYDTAKEAKDEELMGQIRFLIANYLDKAAPDSISSIKKYDPNFNMEAFQAGVFAGTHFYHRMGFPGDADLVASINKDYALGAESPLILTDNTKYTDLFPLSFKVVNNRNDWEEQLYASLKDHIAKYKNPQSALKHALEKNILFDMTEHFSDLIKTEGNKAKEEEFDTQFQTFQTRIRFAMTRVIKKISEEQFNDEALQKNFTKVAEKFIWDNTTFINRIEVGEGSDKMGGMKVMPVLRKFKKKGDIVKKQAVLVDFVHHTGIYISAMKARKHLYDVFAIGKFIHYAGTGRKKVSYFENKEKITEMQVLKRLKSEFASDAFKAEKPHLAILGDATMKLFNGLLSEISDEQWTKINGNDARREILNSTIVSILNKFTTASSQKNDYNQFALSMELIQADLATLLELFRPFKEEDFESIYLSKLEIIPDGLKEYATAGLTRTATNTFAGVYSAVLEANPNAVVANGMGLYYEQASLMPMKSFDQLMEDPAVKEINFYACQFNPSFEIRPEVTGYKANDIASDIKKIFDQKPDTKNLTVLIDCTIDYNNSEKVQSLLSSLQEEIQSGKLNIIFTKSGQKLDMLGMDNYFGSPSYMINNGDEKWDKMNAIYSDPGFKSDPLSLQWFCISNKYASDQIEQYRGAIFNNSKKILSECQSLFTNKRHPQEISISSVDAKYDASFIDLKIRGVGHSHKAKAFLENFYQTMSKHGYKVNRKASFGFFHTNTMWITEGNCSSIRINPGLSAEENEVIIKLLHEVCGSYYRKSKK